MDSTIIELSTPITAHGEQIERLTLRKPQTADMIDLGHPQRPVVIAGQEMAFDVRMNVVASYIARLGAIPMSSVRALSMQDFGKATQVVLGFFGEEDAQTTEDSKTGSSMSPSS